MRLALLAVLAACGSGNATPRDAPVDVTRADDDAVADAFDAGMLVDAQPESDTHSGTRLRLVWTQYADGARTPIYGQYRDIDRDEFCAPRTWSNGHVLCTPLGLYGELVFTDAGCSQPAVQYTLSTSACSPPSSPPRYGSALQGDALSALYQTGAPLYLATYYRVVGGQCQATSMTANDRLAVAMPVDPSSLAELFRDVPLATTRLRHAYYTSLDGLRAWDEPFIFDSLLSRPCSAVTHGSSVVVCVPEGTAEAHLYADAQCTEPIAEVDSTAPMPDFISYFAPSCSEVARVAAVGPEHAGAVFYQYASECHVGNRQSGRHYYRPGGQIAVEALMLDLSHGGARLQEAEYVTADGFRRGASVLFDPQLDDFCRPLTNHGQLRCIPLDVQQARAEYYTASGCSTQTRVRTIFHDRPCGFPTKYAYDVYAPSPGACDVEDFFPILGIHQAPLFTCDGYPITWPVNDVGPAVPPESLVSAAVVSE